MHVTAILAAGGAGSRLGGTIPKQFRYIGGRTILERSVSAFVDPDRNSQVILALPPTATLEGPSGTAVGKFRAVTGGARRQDSVANAFDIVDELSEIVLVHDAA